MNTPDDWEINGNFLTLWINDFEVLTVTPSNAHGFELWHSHVATARSIFLGTWDYRADATRAGDSYVRSRIPKEIR